MAASHISKQDLVNNLCTVIGHEWWHETARLYSAIANASPVITACLAEEHRSPATLLLAFECENEARQLHPSLRTQLQMLREKGVEDSDPQIRHIVAEALLTLRLRHMTSIDENRSVDASLVTCAEYQIFLDEQKVQGRYYYPDHWKSPDFAPDQGNQPVLGMRPSDASAFCAWLTERSQGIWRYRLPRVGETDITENQQLLRELQGGTGFWLDDKQGIIWAPATTPTQLESLRQTLHNIPDFNPDLVRDYGLALNLDPVHAYASDLSHAHVRVLDPNPARVRVHKSARSLYRALDRALDRSHVHDIVHSFGLAFAEDRTLGLDYALDIYIPLLQLVERAAGNLPVYEGILLVRERQQA